MDATNAIKHIVGTAGSRCRPYQVLALNVETNHENLVEFPLLAETGAKIVKSTNNGILR